RSSSQIGGTPGAENFPGVHGPIASTLIARDANWLFEPSGADLGTQWRESDFDDNAWSSSAALFFRSEEAGPPELTVLDSLVARFQADAITGLADGELVATWNDSATSDGQAQNAVASGDPTFYSNVANGHAVVRFDGDTDQLRMETSPGIDGATGFVYFAVVRADRAQEDGGVTDGGGDYLFDRHILNSGSPLVSLKAVGGRFGYQTRYDSGGGIGGPISTTPISTAEFQIVAVRRNVTQSQFEIWVDGRLEGATPDDGQALTPEAISIGRHATAPTGGFSGDMAELLMYDSQLSDEQMRDVTKYLAAQYDVVTQFGPGPRNTEIAAEQSTYYFRHEFNFAGDPTQTELLLEPIVDDGAVVYLNGQEVWRTNLAAGDIGFSTPAQAEIDDPTSIGNVPISNATLNVGRNVLAVELHEAVTSNDALFGVELTAFESLPDPLATPPLVINEMAAAGQDFWLELANTTDQPLALAGYVVSVENNPATEFEFPDAQLPPGATTVVGGDQLGFAPLAGNRVFLFAPGRVEVVDAQIVDTEVRGRISPTDTGWLWPSAATQGAGNQFDLVDDVVINEILYHGPAQFAAAPISVFEGDTSWRYDDSGDDLGVAWREAGFDDSAFATGSSLFGFGAPVDYSSLVLADSPVSYWNFDESDSGAQTAVDQTGDNHGVFGGAAGRTAGLAGLGAARFTGTLGDHVNVGDGGGDFAFSSGMTIEAVVAPDASLGTTHQFEEIFRKEDGNNRILFSFQQFGTILSFGINDGGGYAELDMPLDGLAGRPTLDDLTDGQPHHLAGVYNASTGEKQIWVDGAIAMSAIASPGVDMVSGGAAAAFIGSSGGSSEPFSGIVDEVALYDHALAAERIVAHAEAAEHIEIATALAAGHATYYFRKQFDAPADLSGALLSLNATLDDGAVFYLNGQEIYRHNLPAGPVDANTRVASPLGAPDRVASLALPTEFLRPGENVFAVEIHQAAGDDTDLYFAADLQLGFEFAESPLEWIELTNRGAAPVDLSGWRLDGGVSFQFPPATEIAPGEYLVVASDPTTMASVYSGLTAIGPWQGQLSDSGDEIVLRDARGNPADQLRYYDAGRWDETADGGGATLELRDPRADNAIAESWQASDENASTEWQTITYRGIAAPSAIGPDGVYHEFVLGLISTGEVWIDDLSVVEDPDGAATQLLANGDFEQGTDAWRLLGNHRHSQVIADPENAGNQLLQLVATGPTEHMHNHLETTFADSQQVENGTVYEISYRAKWVAGSSQVNTRLYFNRLARTTTLARSAAPGTPGAANSRFLANAGPVFDGLSHSPVTPAAGEPIDVSVSASDPDQLASIVLRYSVDGGPFVEMPMTFTAGGRYTAQIPGQAAGAIVQFYVEAADMLGATAHFPAAGPESRALLKVDEGLEATNGLHNLQIILTPADRTWLHTDINLMSNDPIGATVIYQGEAYYDVGVRLKGSERGRVTVQRLGFRLTFNPEQLLRGVHDRVAIDRSEGGATGQREMLTNQMMTHAGSVSGEFNDLIQVIAPRIEHTGQAELQLARFGDVMLESQFENGNLGNIHEYELIYYPTTVNVDGYKVPQPDSVLRTAIRNLGDSPEDYRWTFLLKNNRERDDFGSLMEFARVLELTGDAFLADISRVIDVEQWLRNLALAGVTGVGDQFFDNAFHNAVFYERPADGRFLYFPHDLDFAYSTTRSILQNNELNKLIARPAWARLYFGNVLDVIDTTFNLDYMTYWADHFGNLLPGQNFDGHLAALDARSQNVRAQLLQEAPQIAFAITTPDGQSVDQTEFVIEGTAWVNARHLRLAGQAQPLEVEWIDLNTWRVVVPLAAGENQIAIEAYDFQGDLLSSEAITVTSTDASARVSDSLRIAEVNYHP
ncbi:MAG: lamin tail domain-containing protein, partial [Planctomycetales bacterium]|nr:lamin tail domain-containing protein [Planctomycetales bacterium]